MRLVVHRISYSIKINAMMSVQLEQQERGNHAFEVASQIHILKSHIVSMIVQLLFEPLTPVLKIAQTTSIVNHLDDEISTLK